jgi:hypothetical protein
MPHWVVGSTERIAQMSGDYDPENLTHFNFTGAWGVDGVDLGANTKHDGRTVIFFGDVPPQHGRRWMSFAKILAVHRMRNLWRNRTGRQLRFLP